MQRDLAYLLPLVAAMLVIALWPNGIVDTTTTTLERTIAPAQVAAGRPADQIHAAAPRNPPADAEPLPGDETDGTAQAGTAP